MSLSSSHLFAMKIENFNYNSWSELPLDLLSLVFQRLGFADFQQAKSVCSSWHSASKQSLPKNNSIPWLILFPEENNNNNSCCTLFNPEEKDNKVYKTKDLGIEEFAKSVCIATYGSWLLMKSPQGNLYIVNLFTREMINLPHVEKGSIKRSQTFWIDEKTKDYVVLYGRFWRRGKLDVVYCYKKGDDDDVEDMSWKQIPETPNSIHLVYKDHKLYYLSLYGSFKIFDFSSCGEMIPKEIFECGVIVNDRFRMGRVQLQPNNRLCLAATQLVVSVTGEIVFKVEKFLRARSKTWSFRVFKIYSSGIWGNHQMVDSLGDEEAMFFDQGITVLATNEEGFIRSNSIYFSNCSKDNKNHNMFRFDLETKTMEQLHKFDSSSLQFSRARWFLPSFTHT